MSSMNDDNTKNISHIDPILNLEQKNLIKFRNDTPPENYVCFSTFHDALFYSCIFDEKGNVIDERQYRSIEQAFQFSRFFKPITNPMEKQKTEEILTKIMNEESSVEIKKIGETGNKKDYRTNTLIGTGQRAGWEDKVQFPKSTSKSLMPFKYYILFQHMYQKFFQNEEYLAILKSTGKSEIIETSKDEMLGNGKEGNGQNLHGRFLMLIRDTL